MASVSAGQELVPVRRALREWGERQVTAARPAR
jgi:hypothetical protein